MNKLRYYAMRLPREEQSKSVLKASKSFFYRIANRKLEPEINLERTFNLRESTLVALSAMHYFDRSWIENEDERNEIVLENVMRLGQDRQNEFIDEQSGYSYVWELKEKHKKEFGDWPPLPEDVEEFLKLSKGIRMTD